MASARAGNVLGGGDFAPDRLLPDAISAWFAGRPLCIRRPAAQRPFVGAGDAAKGNTLLNFAGVRPDLLPYVVDRNPAKQGKFLPGSRIPIVDEAHLQAHRPERILILPWNLRSELAEQLAPSRDWGAQLVTAVPHLSVWK